MTVTTPAWGATSATTPLAPLPIERRTVGPTDVRIRIEYCGICHSDVHTVRDEWHGTVYPCVPGHEIVGVVAEVGSEVTRYEAGDRVGVGCLVDSCGACESCAEGLENYCTRGATGTYNSVDKHGAAPRTYGGYSAEIVITERFVVRIPDGLDPASAAPLLCAGITTYSPLRHHRVGPGTMVGVVGFGGLGGMAVKLAKAMGAEVTVITRSDSKAEQIRAAGADHLVVSADKAAMKAATGSQDVVLSTIPTAHAAGPYLALLKRDGAYVVLGALEPLTDLIDGRQLIGRRVQITGSMIGGMPETQELLDFCAEHKIVSDVQVIGVDGINAAYDHIAAGDPGFRYVIDLSTI